MGSRFCLHGKTMSKIRVGRPWVRFIRLLRHIPLPTATDIFRADKLCTRCVLRLVLSCLGGSKMDADDVLKSHRFIYCEYQWSSSLRLADQAPILFVIWVRECRSPPWHLMGWGDARQSLSVPWLWWEVLPSKDAPEVLGWLLGPA